MLFSPSATSMPGVNPPSAARSSLDTEFAAALPHIRDPAVPGELRARSCSSSAISASKPSMSARSSDGHVRHLLERAEALGYQQMSDNLVDVEGVYEHLAAAA